MVAFFGAYLHSISLYSEILVMQILFFVIELAVVLAFAWAIAYE
jgi:hypothetical protein